MIPISVGAWEFDHVEYDAESDVLYLSMGAPRPGHGRETPEGHVLLFDQDTDEFCGVTLISVAELMRLHGALKITMPARSEHIAAADLELVLA